MNIPMKDIGYDISEMKLYEDNTMTVEIDTSDWTLEQWAAILGGVPIVRCKDCKHSATGNYFKGIMCGKYRNERGMLFISVEENDYCSRAERKTE